MDHGEQAEVEDRLRHQIDAYHDAALLFAAVTSGALDALKDGPHTPDELDLDLMVKPLRRVLRGLVTLRLCEELPDGRFALTAAGESFAIDSSSSLREKVMVVLSQYWLPWLGLMHCLETGKPSFPHVFGAPVADWRRTHTNEAAPFYRYLAKEEMAHADDLMQSFDEFDAGAMASIGSGYGGFLVPFLRAFPELKAIVFDAPAVVEHAEPMFQAYGLQHQVAFVAGDVLKEIPVAADIYVLKGVLQQHDDAAARKILENCRAALKPDAKLIVYERLMPERAADDPAAVMLDLHLMTIYGGRARTKAEMEELLSHAGFAPPRVTTTYSGLAFIEVKG